MTISDAAEANLLDALREYGRHKSDCRARRAADDGDGHAAEWIDDDQCTCGWSDWIADLASGGRGG